MPARQVAEGQSFDASRALKAGMQVNADRSVEILFKTSEQPWVETEAGGVFRKPIERDGEDYVRCTTTVKFNPNKRFPGHVHGGGEEFFVTQGAWADQFKSSFPKYSYIRNYIGSKHSPLIKEEGTTIMVKLRQMSENMKEPLHKSWYAPPPVVDEQGNLISEDTTDGQKWVALPNGGFRRTLYESALERVHVEFYPKGVDKFEIEVPANGKEVYVVDGSFADKLGEHDELSWARYVEEDKKVECRKPVDEELYFWVKDDHLNSHEVGTRKLPEDDEDAHFSDDE